MARIKDREAAITLRLEGKSYSEIKKILGVSKSTLSSWLHKYPLAKDDVDRLRSKNPIRIEKFRATMAQKRFERESKVYKRVQSQFRHLSKRERVLAGLFLYWAEGTKRSRYTTALANTDPSMIRFFISWLRLLGVPKTKISIRLQVYGDMNPVDEIMWWSKELRVPRTRFKKPYIKGSLQCNITYRSGYGHGTCNVLVHDRDLNDYVLMGIQYLQDTYTR